MVKHGYKQTEIGVIPEDWTVHSMENLTSLMTNGFVGTIKSEYVLSGTGVLYLQGFNIKENAFDLTGVSYVSETFHKKHLKSELKANDLLTVQTGDIGVTAYLPKCFEGANCQSLIISRFYEKFDSRFWSYYFNSVGRKSLHLIETGTTMKHINVGDMKGVLVPVPNAKIEQTNIADALSDVDSMISSLEKLIAKKKAVKQGAMQELLMGKKRLPGFTGEWEIKTLKEISYEIVDGPFGSDLKKEHYTTERQVRIIQLSNIGESGWNDENTKYTTFTHAYELRRCIVQPQAVLIAKMMPAGRAILCPNNEKGYILGSDVVKLIPNDNIDSKYLIYATKSQFYLNQIADDTQGSTRSRTSVRKLRKTSILFPSKKEQTAIASVLSDMDNEIEALEQKLAKTRQIKQGMMQQLLTGKIRLV